MTMNLVQNQVTLIGYLGKDPKALGTGEQAGMRFSLATSETFGPAENRTERTDWHTIVCWNGTAKGCQHLAQGDQVAVFGKLRNNNYTDEAGNEQRRIEVHAADIHFLKVKAFANRDASASSQGSSSKTKGAGRTAKTKTRRSKS